MSKTSISLNTHFDEFISDQIDVGRYDTTSEVIRAGLRLLEEHEIEYTHKMENLRNALIEGEKSEIEKDYSINDIIIQLDNE